MRCAPGRKTKTKGITASMKTLTASLCLLISLVAAGCASPPSRTYYPIGPSASWNLPPKANPLDIQFLRTLPESGFGFLGQLDLSGGQSFQAMLDIATKEAAARGADFVFIKSQNVQTSQVQIPASTTVTSSGTAIVAANGAAAVGVAQAQNSAYSVGPSVRDVKTGNMSFLLGKYPKVWLGLVMEKGRPERKGFISGFSWDSPAPAAGVLVGDEVVAIDGREPADPEGIKFLLVTGKPGDAASVVVRRNGEQKVFQMKYISRFSPKS